MIIEKYEANPAANTFSYVNHVVTRPMRIVQFNQMNNNTTTAMDALMLVYRGTITSYDLANFVYCLLSNREAGNYVRLANVELNPGMYTFACYIITDVANVHWVYYLV